MANQITKTAVCDSCGQEKVVIAAPHNQNNNQKLWWYCDGCKFVSDIEKEVQTKLRQNPQLAEDGTFLNQVTEQAKAELLTKKAEDGTLPTNETVSESNEPSVQEAEVIESTPESTDESTA